MCIIWFVFLFILHQLIQLEKENNTEKQRLLVHHFSLCFHKSYRDVCVCKK